MSLNNIQLPGIVIAGLYKKGLIQGEPEANTVPATATTPPAAVKTVPEAPAAPVKAPATPTATATPVAPSAPASAAYKFLGNNRQNVVVIVRSPGEVFLPESHLQMLTKMLGACKLNLGDVAIVNDATQTIDINLVKEQLFPKKVLLFGIAPDEAGLPLHFPLFKNQDYGGCTYLYAPTLYELNADTEEGKTFKKQLWESLKKIFGV
jgi:hypothetical protein